MRLVPSHGEVAPGQTIRLNAKLVNGPVAATNVPVGFYACLNGLDTVLVGTTVVDRVSPRMETIVSADFTIPDTTVCCTFFAKVDPENRFGEMCEMNNTCDARISLKGPYWILDVTSHPNPMQNETVISYLLPRDVQGMKIAVVSLEGREITVIDGVPQDIGRHSVVFRNPVLASGTYLLRFEGRNEKGDIQTHVSRIVKVQ
ncbi:MAG: hypothetical protein QHI48_12470 [Bacteroidota bacterium]|nr:hypothetical protein [Bacteroidota bacterium]